MLGPSRSCRRQLGAVGPCRDAQMTSSSAAAAASSSSSSSPCFSSCSSPTSSFSSPSSVTVLWLEGIEGAHPPHPSPLAPPPPPPSKKSDFQSSERVISRVQSLASFFLVGCGGPREGRKVLEEQSIEGKEKERGEEERSLCFPLCEGEVAHVVRCYLLSVWNVPCLSLSLSLFLWEDGPARMSFFGCAVFSFFL